MSDIIGLCTLYLYQIIVFSRSQSVSTLYLPSRDTLLRPDIIGRHILMTLRLADILIRGTAKCVQCGRPTYPQATAGKTVTVERASRSTVRIGRASVTVKVTVVRRNIPCAFCHICIACNRPTIPKTHARWAETKICLVNCAVQGIKLYSFD